MLSYKDLESKTYCEDYAKSVPLSMSTKFTKDIQEGNVCILRNGWVAQSMSNVRGNTPIMNVHGYFTEMGSVYVWDIVQVMQGGIAYNIELTDKQTKDMERCI